MSEQTRLILEIEPATVGELRTALAHLPDIMPVSDSVGEQLIMRIYEEVETGAQSLEVA